MIKHYLIFSLILAPIFHKISDEDALTYLSRVTREHCQKDKAGFLMGKDDETDCSGSSRGCEKYGLELTQDHPIKKKLDKLFRHSKALQTPYTLRKYNFEVVGWLGPNHTIVIRHHSIKGYVLKVFVKSQGIESVREHFNSRINGANLIREKIEEKGLNHLFKAPKKWIYSLPNPDGVSCILVAEDAKPYSHERNEKKWMGSQVNKAFLLAFFTIVFECGLVDSIYIDNVPFCKDGKVCFIDTEHTNVWPIDYSRLTKRLHPAMQSIWQKIYSIRPFLIKSLKN